MSEFSELRAQAKALGINTFQMSKSAIQEAITAAEGGGIAPVPEKKKGRTSWRWRNRLEVKNKRDDFRYRFVDRDENNLRDKLEDGWTFVNPLTGIPGEHVDPRQIADGEPLEGVQTFRDLVLMALPEEAAAQRDAAVRSRTEQQTVNLKNQAQGMLKNTHGAEAQVHGNITIID